jgi:hypothetical protein
MAAPPPSATPIDQYAGGVDAMKNSSVAETAGGITEAVGTNHCPAGSASPLSSTLATYTLAAELLCAITEMTAPDDLRSVKRSNSGEPSAS